MDVLHPLSAGLIRGIHIDGRHQFTESIRGEFFNMNVLVRFLDELFNILDLLFLYFNFLLDGENFFPNRALIIMSKRSSLSFPLTLSS